ncbi:MAG TPA: hypothetical protein VLV78_22955 [Thermoanaerobaculia bacterium]|nr:hypothetical protein [Thermoanaerobaculia bacterium]
MSSSNTKILAAVALLITFLVGAVIGVVGDRIFIAIHGAPHRSPQMMARHLGYVLHLSDAQKAQVMEIITRHQQRIAAITATSRPAVQQELEQANAEIERILTPEQREKFARMRMRLLPRRHGAPAQAGAPSR